MKKNHTFRSRFFLLLRTFLILSFAVNLGIGIFIVVRDKDVSKPEVLQELSKTIELAVWAVLTFVLSYTTEYIERNRKVDIPDILEVVIVFFIFAGIFLSNTFNLYYRLWWWDDLLHMFSGVIIGFIGFILIYTINHKHSMDISPLLVAVFSFSFAVTIGVFWEIAEF